MTVAIGIDRIAVRRPPRDRAGYCPTDGSRGVFYGTALICPHCGKLLGGF